MNGVFMECNELTQRSYAVGGALEDTTLPAIRSQFETNFFGSVRTTQAIIPLMRQQSSGTIVNISSTEGISTVPGLSIYSASKHALEAVSDALFGELAPFGIRVLSIQPGAMRTKFLDPSNAVEVPVSEPYKGGPVEKVLGWVMGNAGKESIDPELAAKRIAEAVVGGGEGWPEGREKYLRLPLGKESGNRFAAKIENLRENADAMAAVTGSVDFDE